MTQFKEKGVKRVPLFISDERTMHTLFVSVSFHRLINFFNAGYFLLSGYTLVFARLADPNLLYICTAGITCMNLFYTHFMRKLRRTACNRIEWDVPSESFVVVRPRGLFGEVQDMLPLGELIMNSKSKERDCIYFDGLTGQGIATVNRGQWYNMMLFMHVMQKYNKNGKTQPVIDKQAGLASPFADSKGAQEKESVF